MLKVLIVDDEFIVRVGLRNCIDWDTMNLRLMGEAENGAEALQLIEKEVPDIILLDIMMPVMNGIELMNELAAREIRTNIVILSCHGDYSHVREAFKIGVQDYILKLSSDPEEICRVLTSVAKRIMGGSPYNTEGHVPAKAQKRFKEIKDISPVLQGREYYIASFCCNGLTSGEVSVIYGLCEDMLAKRSADSINTAAAVYNDSIPCIVRNYPAGAGEAGLDIFKSDLQELLHALPAYISSFPHIGISLLKGSREQLIEAVKESQKAVKFLFYSEGERMADLSQLSRFSTFNLYYSKEFERKLKINIERRDMPEIQNLIETFLRNVNECACVSPDVLKLNVIEIVNAFNSYIRTFGYSISDLDTEYMYYYQQIAAIMSFDGLREWMCGFLEVFGGFLCALNKETVRGDIIEALSYIEENYSTDISLHDLARHVNISKSHLSYIFKKETGETFSDYVNKIRIEKARELLASGKYKINEISDMVGFNNTGYFSKVFKKSTGTSPLDYKHQGILRSGREACCVPF